MVSALTAGFQKAMLLLPFRRASALTAMIGSLAFDLFRTERRKTLGNIELAYGSALTETERRWLGRQVYRNAGRSVAEIAFMAAGRGDSILERAEVRGLENALQILRGGQGVIAVTAHFGNWELIPPFVISHLDCEIGVVARALSNPGLDRFVSGFREKCGARVFPRGQTGRRYVQFLREGNVLGILGDIDTLKGDGLFVRFFGRPAWTQSGIARLARMGRARLIPVFDFRDPADPEHHVLMVEPPIEEPEGDISENEWIARMTQSFTAAIEQAVRRQPDQWMWMHRRWRHQDGDDRFMRRLRKRGVKQLVIDET